MSDEVKASYFFDGRLALGLVLGFVITAIGGLVLTPCSDATSTLWFCGESNEIVLGTLEFIQSSVIGLAWPLVAVILGFIFRTQIREVIPRLKRAGPSGIELNDATLKQTLKPTKLDELEQFPGIERSKSGAELEIELHGNLPDGDDLSKINLLIRELAQSRLDFAFLDIYHRILGGQVRLLNLIKINGGQISEKILIEFWHDLEAESEYYVEFGLNGFLSFLENRELIKRLSSGESVLTAFGYDFLLFIFRNSLPEKQ